MYNKTLKSFLLIMIASVVMSSCIGSFGLFNKVLDWNKDATGNKFLNELIFIVISPAYVLCGTADLLVLNTIEFWSGSNPLAENVGKTESIMGSDGKLYAVTTLKDGYEIKDADGNVMNFTYNEKDNTWAVEKDGTTTVLLKMKGNDTAQIYLPGGKTMDVTLDKQGLYEARMAVNEGVYFAARLQRGGAAAVNMH